MEARGKPNDIIGVTRRKAGPEAKAGDIAFGLPVYFLSFQGMAVFEWP
jgi:hypothetical protein